MSRLRFSPAHVWVRADDGEAVLGLTDYLQDQMGQLTGIDLPDLGDILKMSRRMGHAESEEASAPLESPVNGEVVEVNNEVLEHPDLVNSEPYDSGWLLRVRLDDPSELDDLMSEEEYTELTNEV